MIISWIIGFILVVVCIWVLKNTRNNKGEPVLKVWSLLVIFTGGIIPIISIILVSSIITISAINYSNNDWVFIKGDLRFIKFLQKPIK